MTRVVKRDHYYVTRYTTGPQDLLLMLDMENARIFDPFVTALAVCPIYGQPDESTVRAAVLTGADEANTQFGTSWYPLENRYWYSGYDNAKCTLMGRAAFDVVKELAERGPDGIEMIAESECVYADRHRQVRHWRRSLLQAGTSIAKALRDRKL